MKVLIAVPCKNDIQADTFKSIYDQKILGGYKVDFEYFTGYAIDQQRNTIARYAIVKNYDYVFMVDSDIILPNDALKKLLSHKENVISGIYRRKVPNIEYEIFDTFGSRFKEIPKQKLMEIGACGMGCALIKTEVLTKIGYPQFTYSQKESFFDSISEDHDFCLKSRINGFNIWVDTTVRCNHIGSITYEA